MLANKKFTKTIALSDYGIEGALTYYQLPPEELHQITVEKGQGVEADSGALAVNTGEFTGRSPKDRFIVKDDITEEEVWWGDINKPFEPKDFEDLYDKVTDYLSGKEVFVRDCYACAAKNHKMNIRIINEHPWANMFAHNMFLRLREDELEHFKEDWLIVNAPGFRANPEEDKTRQHNFAILDFSRKIVLIGGTGYTGEIKKSIFSALNFILPVYENTLPMHCSANIGAKDDTALLFGLSGTGKTTLSADPNRKLIGDDEHGWSEGNKIFNFEGGCYAKVINLTEEEEPEIFRAIKPGAILENVILDHEGKVDFTSTSITQNTRVSYPLDHIEDIARPSIGAQPENIFFLTADAFGVLPPISELTPEQAAYHFISGYTAKVAGTKAGIDEPVPDFSACFGEPFMPLHPVRYADMLRKKMKETGVHVWLINTGWTGGPYGEGSRMKLTYTRNLINAALEGKFQEISFKKHPVFGLAIPVECPGVPAEVLDPRSTWKDKEAYDAKAYKLAKSFIENFRKYETEADEKIIGAAPVAKSPQ